MSEFLAHSANGGYPAQTYEAHVDGVCRRSCCYAEEVEKYARGGACGIADVVEVSALYHDLGKLADKNQAALRGEIHCRHLPVNHVDAGSAALKKTKHFCAALTVYSHHRGLPDMSAETIRDDAIFRDEHPSTRKEVDSDLPVLLHRHLELVKEEPDQKGFQYAGDFAVSSRMALSCLADADYTDTAAARGETPQEERLPALRAQERLEALNQYVAALGSSDDTRNRLRQQMYVACRDAKVTNNFCACDSPVGSGKTTAVMAHLLAQAVSRNARHIFVILPYTSIIHQAVEVYRNALCLPGEDPEKVVAELHSRADFQDRDTRYLTSLWRSPIIVTTAVAFFETLASNRPATLRRYHELPGSVLFVDEAHNALPIRLLPLAWHWMNTLAAQWSCYWVLASGSLVRYWELDDLASIQMERPQVPDLIDPKLRGELMHYEHGRISFRWRNEPISRRELTQWVQSLPGPRLLIVNTVQSAAVLATDLKDIYGRECVEHLSTALTPTDRQQVIQRIKQRLCNKSDTDWTLVATSCVEAGVDFSFRSGFRELSSLLSLLQAAGRVNREGEFRNADMWSFTLQDDSMLKSNPALKTSRRVLKGYFESNLAIVPECSTQSLVDEIAEDDSCLGEMQQLMKAEQNCLWKTVEEDFSVIDSDTVCAVISDSLAEAITEGKGDWQTLQNESVSIRRHNIRPWGLKEIAGGIYKWTLAYDSFLGYMSGVLQRPQ